MIKIDRQLIEEVLAEAENSIRKRAIKNLGSPNDKLQRLINAGTCETYVRPHKHQDPDKLETFTILEGIVAVVEFDDAGEIRDIATLDYGGDVKSVEIAPRTWHSFVIMSPVAALYEILDGMYNPMSHKNFPHWAPAENDPYTRNYLYELRDKIEDCS